MIFSHMQKPLGMRIYVHGVPSDTSWFFPYCCAIVDTALVTRRGRGSRTGTSAGLTRPLGYSPLLFADVSGCNHNEKHTGYKHLIKNNAVDLVLSFS
jgi:hypothetical protein